MLYYRAQVLSILHTHVPWFTKDSASRLFSAYDPTRTGVIRYIRLSTALLLCTRPAMTDLIALQTRMKALMEGNMVVVVVV